MFGISKREIKQAIAIILAFVVLLSTTPISSFATDVAGMLRGMLGNSRDVSGGDVSGGDVSGGDVSGGDVSSGDFLVKVTGDGTVVVTQKNDATIGEVTGTSEETSEETINTELGRVGVTITPADATDTNDDGVRNYIKSAVLDNNPLQGREEITDGFDVTEDSLSHTLVVEFGTEYLYTVSKGEGGTVSLSVGDDTKQCTNEETEIWVDSAADVSLNIEADTANHYVIKSVTINDNPPTGSNELEEHATSYSYSDMPVGVTEIAVEFVQLYTVSVTINGDGTTTVNGVSVVPGSNGVFVSEWDGNQATFLAQPEEGYRVSEVWLNDVEDTTVQGNNGEAYLKYITAPGEYQFDVIFEPNQYVFSVKDFENATLTTSVAGTEIEDGDIVEYGDVVSGVIVPEVGYSVSKVEYVEEGKVTVELPFTSGANGIEFVTPSVENNCEIKITVVEFETANDAPVMSETGIVGTHYKVEYENGTMVASGEMDGIPYVIVPEGTTVKFTTKENEKYLVLAVNGDVSSATETSVVITETTHIQKIQVSVDEKVSVAGNACNVICDYWIIVDEKAPEVTLTVPELGEGKSHYDGDVVITVEIEDKVSADVDFAGISSGVKEVAYVITDGTETENDTLNVTAGETVGTWIGEITVSKDKFEGDDIEVTVAVTDKAGNKKDEDVTQTISIDATAPVINVIFADEIVPEGEEKSEAEKAPSKDEKKYFSSDRMATITIEDSTFANQNTEVVLVVTAKDIDGNDITLEEEIKIADSAWQIVTENEKTVYKASVVFSEEAHYAWSIKCTDAAGNETTKVCDEFALDTNKPTGTIKINNAAYSAEVEDEYKTGAQNIINTNADISFDYTDKISTIEKIEYCVVKGDAPADGITIDALSKLTWTEWNGETLSETASVKFVVYARITDLVGRVTYLASAGTIIADNVAPSIDSIVPGTSTSFNGLGLSNGDVSVSVSVSDPTSGNGVATGVQTITYVVYSNGSATQSGTLQGGNIVVDAASNNSNNVSVSITATDLAGNTSSSSSPTFMIDTTIPTIYVSYDNNAADSESFYSQNRVATVTITERNFDPEKVVVNITNTDGVVPVISEWVSNGSGDGATHVATIEYTADGDYTFDISVTDAAGNVSNGVTFAEGTTNPNAFTIDKTAPRINVEYGDVDDELNGKYFAKDRTATITITEHNFDANRVVAKIDASFDGEKIESPKVTWTNVGGDVYRAVVEYTADGDYLFDISMKDKAGNDNTESVYDSDAAKDFVIDKETPELTISGVEDGKALAGETFTISYDDINLDTAEVRLYRTKNGESRKDVTSDYLAVTEETKWGGKTYTATISSDTQENDGIYSLEIKIVDKAGYEADVKEKIVFTVNNYGSVYVFNDALINLIEAGYVQQVEQELVIYEYNADKLTTDACKVEITKDGTPLSNVNVTPTLVNADAIASGEVSWYQYEYKIPTSYFTEDGIYKITVSSEDAAGNKPETANYENLGIMFRVDTVAAEITSVRGLEERIVNDTGKTVYFDVFDAIGLKKVTVYVDDVATVYDQFSDINNYSGEFAIGEGTNQKVRIVVEDIAGNVTDTEAETFAPAYAFNETITVSTSFWVRFMANKPLFFGSIAGVTALAGGSVGGVMFRRRKKGLGKR